MDQNGEVKILVVEDDEGHAELLRLNLERSGLTHPIIHFSDGMKSLNFLLQDVSAQVRKTYLVLLDLNMPGLNGMQVLTRLRQADAVRNVPVIVFSTAEDENCIRECYALGCNLYMNKPIDYADFAQAVQELGQFIQKARFPGIMKTMEEIKV